ncbi:hypothetical protein KM043_014606 [Ampulex compressa]|nr:hypothetical protein KM043_014606 [Ampulex compressa]
MGERESAIEGVEPKKVVPWIGREAMTLLEEDQRSMRGVRRGRCGRRVVLARSRRSRGSWGPTERRRPRRRREPRRDEATDGCSWLCRRHHLSRSKAPCITERRVSTQPSPSCHEARGAIVPVVPPWADANVKSQARRAESGSSTASIGCGSSGVYAGPVPASNIGQWARAMMATRTCAARPPSGALP